MSGPSYAGERGVAGTPGKLTAVEVAKLSRMELEFMRLGLQEEIAGLQLQLDWVEDAIARAREPEMSEEDKLPAPSKTYICPWCGALSYNPNDVGQCYCGACHKWGVPAKTEPSQ